MPETPATVRVTAPVQRKIERIGAQGVPYTVKLPQVRGGVCEFCGILDGNLPAEHQYKLCPHFREFGELRCSYCPDSKDPVDVVGHTTLNIHEHPDKPGTFIVRCNTFECVQKHEARFKTSLR